MSFLKHTGLHCNERIEKPALDVKIIQPDKRSDTRRIANNFDNRGLYIYDTFKPSQTCMLKKTNTIFQAWRRDSNAAGCSGMSPRAGPGCVLPTDTGRHRVRFRYLKTAGIRHPFPL